MLFCVALHRVKAKCGMNSEMGVTVADLVKGVSAEMKDLRANY